MRYFEAKTIGGNGSVHIVDSAESMEAFKSRPGVAGLEKFWVTQYREVTLEEVEKGERKLQDYIENGDKVIQIDKGDEYSENIIDYHDGNILTILDNGFTIIGPKESLEDILSSID